MSFTRNSTKKIMTAEIKVGVLAATGAVGAAVNLGRLDRLDKDTLFGGAGSTVGGWVLDETDCTSQVEQALEERSISASVQLITPDFKGVEGEIIER